MEKNEIEQLVARMIADAKLEVVQKRLELILWIGGALLALFGVVVPVWQTTKSTDRLELATRDMKIDLAQMSQALRADSKISSEKLEKGGNDLRAEFKELASEQRSEIGTAMRKIDEAGSNLRSQFEQLAGAQMRKPLLECLFNGRGLEGTALSLSPSRGSLQLELKNIGDGPARNIRVRLYANLEKQFDVTGDQTQWQALSISDEAGYSRAFETYQPFSSIDPKESRPLDISLPVEAMGIQTFPLLMKIFYEQPEPRRYVFTISVTSEKD